MQLTIRLWYLGGNTFKSQLVKSADAEPMDKIQISTSLKKKIHVQPLYFNGKKHGFTVFKKNPNCIICIQLVSRTETKMFSLLPLQLSFQKK